MLSSGRSSSSSPRPAARRRPSVGPRLAALESRILPATFILDSFLDTPDANPGDGLARDANGRITLRAAIMESNVQPDSDVILLGAGTYTLTRTGPGEDKADTGDLDITNPLTIIGGNSVIDGNKQDRLFDVFAPGALSVFGVTLTGGRADEGGAVRVLTGGQLFFDNDVFRDNAATQGAGGAILIAGGSLESASAFFDTNSAAGPGGAIAVRGGTATVVGAAFVGNTATSGGGLAVLDGGATVTISTFGGNRATGAGGAVAVLAAGATVSGVSLAASTVSANTAGVGGGLSAVGPFFVTDSIVAGNSAPGTPDVSGAFVSNGFNLIGNGSGATGFGVSGDLLGTATTPIDPRLSPIGMNGGLTPTFIPLPGSPALNAGNNAGLPPTDQRGFPRLQGPAGDIGSVEARTFSLVNLSSGATAAIGTTINPPLQVQFTEGDLGIAGVAITFTAPTSGPSGTFSGTPTVLTDSKGIATAPAFTANDMVGAYNVRATLGGVLSIDVPVTNSAAVIPSITIDSPPTQATAGVPVSLTLTIRDPAGNRLTNFTGTVTVSNDDPLGDPPVNVSFTLADAGSKTVEFKLRQAGQHTVRAEFPEQSTGAATALITVLAGPVSTLILQAPEQIDSETPFSVSLTARDEFDNLATGYTGPVTLSSTDPNATLPAVIFNPGTGTATVSGIVLRTAGLQTLTAKDTPAEVQAEAGILVIGVASVTLDPVSGFEGAPVLLTGRFSSRLPDGPHTVTINWGDGTAPTILNLAPGATTFTTPHTYADNAPSGASTPGGGNGSGGFSITAVVSDSSASTASGSVTAQIANVAPVVALADRRAILTADKPFGGNGVFVDPGADIWSATVDYGDGTGEQSLTLNADKSFTLEHVYTSEGTFSVLVRVRDDDGAFGIARERVAVFLPGTTSLVVRDVAPGETATLVSDGISVVYQNNSPDTTATVVIGRVDPAALSSLDETDPVDAYDIRVIDGDVRSVMTATFSFTPNATNTGIPDVLFFDSAAGIFRQVRSSAGTQQPFTLNRADNTVTVLIDGTTSSPTILQLGGTLFTLSVPAQTPQPVASAQVFLALPGTTGLAVADAGANIRQLGSSTGLVSSSEVTLTLSASEGLRRGGFEDDTPRRLPLNVETLQQVYDTVRDLSTLLIETLRMWIEPPPMAAPAVPGPEIPPEGAVDAVRVDDLAQPHSAAQVVVATIPAVIDIPTNLYAAPAVGPTNSAGDAPMRVRIQEEPSEEERAAALVTGLWLGANLLHATAPIPPSEEEEERPRRRPRWRPRTLNDWQNN